MRASDSEEKLPRLLHFVWAGGEKIMQPWHREAVLAWAKANLSFRVCIWVDVKTTSLTTFKNYFRADDEATFLNQPNICLKDINTFDELRGGDLDTTYFAATEKIRRANETQNPSVGVAIPIVRYEIDRFDPNYGASSDLLRYLILYHFGGAYFDSDINPGATNLEALYRALEIRKEDIFLIGENSQNTNRAGNDSFVCSKRHLWMSNIIDTVKQNYVLSAKENGAIFAVEYYAFGDKRNYEVTTLWKTGPEVIKCFGMTQKIIDGCLLPVEQHKLHKQFYTPFEENTFEWIQEAVPRAQMSIEAAIAIAINTIEFEANALGFMRFDDHVWRVMKATSKQGIQYDVESSDYEKEIAARLLASIATNPNIDKAKIAYVQYFTRHHAFLNYYVALPQLVFKQDDQQDFNRLFAQYHQKAEIGVRVGVDENIPVLSNINKLIEKSLLVEIQKTYNRLANLALQSQQAQYGQRSSRLVGKLPMGKPPATSAAKKPCCIM